ncbi:(5-formylfuran-3-yl)methyl phosphate synthase [Aurantimonas sp. 22II-16-19i]|uniref:(5-formylfuran-3-yl)methyl phosphate synthase n=1 Tax=Aurantimonas sp. 22II-16-19i TaxID=1317114 RepID=UPI0009F7EE28|nr:(5-formylfuran-3-yl)methyl phosphate synthase [Aurantimonas sp. 22II-16-19i]ORE92704.1 dihydroneopterin aldolase [Aurantimonas sp. 22II-16-19i]
MTKLLASVTGPGEAETALLGGADIIDLKDPARGALGAVSPEVLAATIATVAGRRPVSAVAGDLPMRPDLVVGEVEARRAADFVKIGLFPATSVERLAVIGALAAVARDIRLVAVFFADGEPDFALLGPLAEAGFHGAMIDTMDKAGGGLLTRLSVGTLARFVETARDFGLMTGLAGSLEAPDVPRLKALRPDYLGFRGALTGGARGDAVEETQVRRIASLLRPETGAAAGAGPAPTVDPAPAGHSGLDRIFVRDLVLDLEIGAYGHERGRRQKVRFSVEALIARIAANRDDIAEVYSYDLITDAVRALAEAGHTDLVETLALDLARTVLSDGRVFEVSVRVEKLELGAGAVGIEIRRRRSDFAD